MDQPGIEDHPAVVGTSGTVELHEVDAARAREYALLAVLLMGPPNNRSMQQLAALAGDQTLLGRAHATLADAASRARPEDIEQEYFKLFVGIGRGELLPYGSYYLTGFLHERPLARLRATLARLGVERTPGQAEPEDHAAILCEIMAGLIRGEFAAAKDAERDFFEQHLSPWIARFFADLEHAEVAKFYRAVGALGRIFIEIETEAFELPNRSA